MKYTVKNYDLKLVLDKFKEKYDRDKTIGKVDYQEWRCLVRLSTTYPNISFTKNDSNSWEVQANGFFGVMNLPSEFINTVSEYSEKESYKMNMNNDACCGSNTPARKMPNMNIEFGPMSTNSVAISPYGLAVRARSSAPWLTYNPVTGQTIDVTGFTFDFENMIYKMPAAVSSIEPGDMILHQNKPMFVTEVGKHIEAIDILDSEAKTIIPVTNMFGFNFVTKIVSFINLGNAKPSEDQPFGNLMPMMMAQMLFNGDSDMDFSKMMMLSMMMGGSNPFAGIFNFGTAAPEVNSAT